MISHEFCQAFLPTFATWAEPWCRLGFWLSLWDDQAHRIDPTGVRNVFWDNLYDYSDRFQQRIRQVARRAQQGNRVTAELDGLGNTIVIALPVRHRHRVIGSLVACTMTDDALNNETFARFCSVYEVDRLVFERLATECSHCQTSQRQAHIDLLDQQVQSLSTAALTTRDVHDLSTHLARVYEELHLIYRVGMEMTVFKPSETHFAELCEELTAGTVVRNVAVVLEPPPGAGTQPTVICSGPLTATSSDLAKLYQQVRDLPRNADPAFVLNAPQADEAFNWTSGWLEQLIFCELSRKDRRFGGILAINHEHHDDFASYEIQLLNAIAERSSAFVESVHLYDDLERLFIGMLHALVSSIDAKDPYTCGHSQRVAWLSRHLASLADVPAERCDRVYLSGLLHDIGKIGISESVLRKTGKLTDEEFKEIQQHPAIGARILQGVPNVEDLIPGILHHHERVDGTGYPNSLKIEEISLLGRLVGLADSFDAMTTDRTYRKARPITTATDEIQRCAGTQFDPELADLLLQENLEDIGEQLAKIAEQPIRPALWSGPSETRGGER